MVCYSDGPLLKNWVLNFCVLVSNQPFSAVFVMGSVVLNKLYLLQLPSRFSLSLHSMLASTCSISCANLLSSRPPTVARLTIRVWLASARFVNCMQICHSLTCLFSQSMYYLFTGVRTNNCEKSVDSSDGVVWSLKAENPYTRLWLDIVSECAWLQLFLLCMKQWFRIRNTADSVQLQARKQIKKLFTQHKLSTHLLRGLLWDFSL